MAESVQREDKRLECPVCLDFFEKPIRQCIIGHSFCGKCLDPMNIKICPECRSDVTDTRNYKLEELLEEVRLPCVYNKSGCSFVLSKDQMVAHIVECKHRVQPCEGKKYCNWECKWQGNDILEHFKKMHISNAQMEFNTNATVPFNITHNFLDLHIISAHYQLFWYKHKISIEKKKAYWAIQMIGLRKNAKHYYYEFEIYNEADPIQKFKITEYCTSDLEDINNIFDTEKCVAISFTMLKNYINEQNMYSFRFRLMKIPNPDKSKVRSKSASRTPIKNKGGPCREAQVSMEPPRIHNMQPQRFDANAAGWFTFYNQNLPKPAPTRRQK